MIMRILATIGTICTGGAIILVIVAIVAAVKETLREKKERKYICALADCECVHSSDRSTCSECEIYRGKRLRTEEKKIKEEYEWHHRPIHNEEYDMLFERINKALGIELWIWQKTYITMGVYRCIGATTAESIQLLLFSGETPLDLSEPARSNIERAEREQLKDIYEKLNAAGIKTRRVFWSKREKENELQAKKEKK